MPLRWGRMGGEDTSLHVCIPRSLCYQWTLPFGIQCRVLWRWCKLYPSRYCDHSRTVLSHWQVKDFAKVSFDARALLENIVQIYLNLAAHDSFCQAVCQDERSYSPELFQQTQQTLRYVWLCSVWLRYDVVLLVMVSELSWLHHPSHNVYIHA